MSIYVDIKKAFPGFTLQVQFEAENERVGLLGASGCGKSMTLKCIAGIEKPDSGKIILNGTTLFDSDRNINLSPQKRHTGYLFQNYALFPTMTITENLALVLRDLPRAEKQRRIDDIFEKLHLEGLAKRYPAQLSGGQQQRAALARMLVSKPLILMLDEPFSALDAYLRSQVEQELLDSLKLFSGTILFVSHNRDEVYRICDRMIVLQEGNIVAAGNKDAIFKKPGSLAAARLTGCKNLAPAIKKGEFRVEVPLWGLELETAEPVPDSIKYLGLRSHHIREPLPGEQKNCFRFQVQRFNGAPFTVTELLSLQKAQGLDNVDPEADTLIRRDLMLVNPDEANLAEGQSIDLCLPAEHLLLLGD